MAWGNLPSYHLWWCWLPLFTLFSSKKRHQVQKAVVRGQVVSDHGWLVPVSRPGDSRGSRPGDSGGVAPGFKAIRCWVHQRCTLDTWLVLAFLDTLHPGHAMHQVGWYGWICFGIGYAGRRHGCASVSLPITTLDYKSLTRLWLTK